MWNEDIKVFVKTFQDELEVYFISMKINIINGYLSEQWIELRNNSIRSLNFPFNSYRKGQRELAVSVYKTITEGKSIFAQAPTGIGKTISTLFPTVKAMGEGYISKIFYLTAKTITRQVAEEAINKMRDCNLSFKAITLLQG